MTIILYLETVLGILFVIRTLQFFRARALLSTSTVTKTGTGYTCVSTWIVFFCPHSSPLTMLIVVFLNLSCPLLLFLLERHQTEKLRQEVPLFLDKWILNLRLGLAPTPAREAALSAQTEKFHTLVRPLFSSALGPSDLPRSHTLFTATVVRELQRIQSEPHTALSRLENLRAMLRRASDFRRKSGHAVRQTLIQSLVMMALLLALLGFTLHRYGWSQCYDLILCSLGLSGIGTIAMYTVSRKAKWKI